MKPRLLRLPAPFTGYWYAQRRHMTMPLPGSGRTALAEPLTPLTSSRRYAAAAGEMAGLDSGTAAELDRDGPVIGRRPK